MNGIILLYVSQETTHQNDIYIIPMDMRGCICHFVKIHVYPSIAKGGDNHVCMYIYMNHCFTFKLPWPTCILVFYFFFVNNSPVRYFFGTCTVIFHEIYRHRILLIQNHLGIRHKHKWNKCFFQWCGAILFGLHQFSSNWSYFWPCQCNDILFVMYKMEYNYSLLVEIGNLNYFTLGCVYVF